MNRVKIEIYNEELGLYQDYSSYVAMPFKISELLDERLDEAELQLQYTSQAIFEPLTKVKITIINKPNNKLTQNDYDALFGNSDFNLSDYESSFISNKVSIQKEILMLVANDQATERPIGSGRYNHVLYLIEFTKFLEGFIGDSLTFTNALGRQTQGSNFAQCFYRSEVQNAGTGYLPVVKTGFFTSSAFPIDVVSTSGNVSFLSPSVLRANENLPSEIVFPDEGSDYTAKIKSLQSASGESFTVTNNKATLPIGIYKITYEYRYLYVNGTTGDTTRQLLELEYTFNVVNSIVPIKKWTITDVICRILETVEVLRGFNQGENLPRFKLQGVKYRVEDGVIKRSYKANSLAEKLDKILAPEFVLSKMTLREMLQQIGGYIHGEPRILGLIEDEEILFKEGNVGRYKYFNFYEIGFDEYGQTEKTYLANKNTAYITQEQSININDYCTALDSSVDNLINALNYAQGVIVEPFNGQFKGVRTTKATIRLETNDSAIIETTKPIYEIGLENQVIWLYNGREYDITPFIYPLADYQNLSSYGGSYPYNKAYALYYVPGEKNIRGLFFKNPDAVDSYFQNWAINNILTSVLGGATMNITTVAEVANLKFQVRYVPYNKERIRTTKPIIKTGLPRTMAYNQGANAVETRFYGEHLKGLITRLGNVEKSVTYLFSYLTEIPKVGLKYDDTYYISAVTTEVLPTCFKCTLALTNHFNRQSEYVGLNSEKRMWEISERQATERESIITDYVKIFETPEASTISYDIYALYNKFLSQQFDITKELLNLNAARVQESTRQPISAVAIKPYTKSGLEIATSGYIVLPVTSTAYGNSIVFSFDFEDNYSAGQRISESRSDYYSDYVSYTDYYGRVYSFYMAFSEGGSVGDPKTLPLANDQPPNPLFVAEDNTAICYQKDNREVPAISYELQFVSDGSVIIGSALGSNCRLVNYSPSKLMFVLLDKEISLLENKNFASWHMLPIPLGEEPYKTMMPIEAAMLIQENLGKAYIELFEFNINHKAWAIITEPTEKQLTVVDEDGNTDTQTIYEGGELVLGQNKPSQGQCIAFQMLSDIYKKF